METEPEWIRAAVLGDRAAFGQLVEAYQRPVYSLAYRMLGRSTDAEDASQEAFFKAYRALASYDPSRSFSTWLLSITAHHCIDRLRRRRGDEIALEDIPPWRSPAAVTVDPERAALDADRADWMLGLLAGLSAADRLVIVLRYWHDLGYLEIAEMTHASEAAVKSRLHRARRQLAVAMANQSPPQAPPDMQAKDAGGQPLDRTHIERSESWTRAALSSRH